jgi:molybdopterin-guanine dinucleotide biosynthesis protein B
MDGRLSGVTAQKTPSPGIGMKQNTTVPIHIVGRRNHGKTTLIVALIKHYSNRGIRVGTIKHSSHFHELDTEGKGSYQHRTAGANPAAIITSGLTGVYLPDLSDDQTYAELLPLYNDCDLILVEGDIDRNGVKVEVWRPVSNSVPLASERSDIRAIITDHPVDLAITVWPRSNVDQLAKNLLALARRPETMAQQK